MDTFHVWRWDKAAQVYRCKHCKIAAKYPWNLDPRPKCIPR